MSHVADPHAYKKVRVGKINVWKSQKHTRCAAQTLRCPEVNSQWKPVFGSM
jgi:hypothetical protein